MGWPRGSGWAWHWPPRSCCPRIRCGGPGRHRRDLRDRALGALRGRRGTGAAGRGQRGQRGDAQQHPGRPGPGGRPRPPARGWSIQASGPPADSGRQYGSPADWLRALCRISAGSRTAAGGLRVCRRPAPGRSSRGFRSQMVPSRDSPSGPGSALSSGPRYAPAQPRNRNSSPLNMGNVSASNVTPLTSATQNAAIRAWPSSCCRRSVVRCRPAAAQCIPAKYRMSSAEHTDDAELDQAEQVGVVGVPVQLGHERAEAPAEERPLQDVLEPRPRSRLSGWTR